MKNLLRSLLFSFMGIIVAFSFSITNASAEETVADDPSLYQDGEIVRQSVEPVETIAEKLEKARLALNPDADVVYEYFNGAGGSTVTNSSIGGYTESWKVASKTFTGESFGAWTDCVSTLTAGTLTCMKSVSLSNSYTGTLKAAKSAVDASVGFNITKTWTTTASYSVNAKARQKIQYRKVYDNYSVKQDLIRHYLITGKKQILDTKYVYPRKSSHIEYRVVGY